MCCSYPRIFFPIQHSGNTVLMDIASNSTKGIENRNIKVKLLSMMPPKILSNNVKMRCFVFWLNANIVAHFSQKGGSDITKSHCDGWRDEQLKACSTVNCLLQMHTKVSEGGCHPKCRQRASLKSPLWRAKVHERLRGDQ